MPNSKHLTHGISNLVSLITKTKLGLSAALVMELAAPVAPFRLSSGNPARMSIFKDWTGKSLRLAALIMAPL
jgi:hypothetical protein